MRSLHVAFAVAVLATSALAANNTLGTWKVNPAKSKPAAGVSPVSNLTTVREMVGDAIKVSGKGERADGTKIDFSYTAKPDGKEVTISGVGLAYDTVAMQAATDNEVTSVNTKKGGRYKATSRFVVTNDGKTATLTSKGTGADGKPFTSVSVWDRQ